MEEAVIDDLKQFILATVSQATAHLATKDDLKEFAKKVDMDARFDAVDKRFDDLELKIDSIADAHAERLDEHDKAIGQLQQHVGLQTI